MLEDILYFNLIVLLPKLLINCYHFVIMFIKYKCFQLGKICLKQAEIIILKVAGYMREEGTVAAQRNI